MEINVLAVVVCAALSMVIGYIWYGPLFGKKWMHLTGMDTMTPEECKQKQKAAGPLYIVQFLLTLFQVYILAGYLGGLKDVSGLRQSLLIWAAFIMPIVAGSCMWNNDSRKNIWTRFSIQAGYQLVLFVVFSLILSYWK
jgi:hypothetical protein